MGSVWRARHGTLGRSFAIKFLKTTIMGGEPLEQRFLREARLAASVQHRFVVDIVDYGVTGDAVPYMVMEYLEGESLDRRTRRQPPLRVRELLKLSAEVLLGLEAVHQAGVIHRDLKPENIMLVREADGIIPKLVDFGISRPETERLDGRKRLTNPGAFLGTPWYMSPEQARRDEADRRSDLYAMGVILYEALCGEAPYDDPELPTLLESVKAGGAPALVTRRAELGPELSAAIERAMALDPAARFESAAEMSARLLELAAEMPEELACPEPTTVSRTDTELVNRAGAAARNRTQELDDGPPPEVVRAGVGRRAATGRERVVAVAGALAGAVLLFWVADKARQRPDRPGAEVLQASVQAAVVPEVISEIRVARPELRAERAARTFTSGAPAALGAARPTADEPEPRRTSHRPARAQARPRATTAVPDVFRSPGF
jgi:serine/threonine-protein kinase